MSEGNYWKNGGVTRRHIARRAFLRGTIIGVAGIAGAALIGCGGDDAPSAPGTGAASPGTSTALPGGAAAPANGAPANIVRGDGFDPALGIIEINTRERVPGGTFRLMLRDTTRQSDPDVTVGGGPHQFVNDRLFYSNPWNMALTPDMLESYEVTDPQGLEMILRLRPGIKTHNRPPVNGRVFTAEDVVYSIRRKSGLLNPDASQRYPRRGQFRGLSGVEAVDERTVRLTLSEPNGSIFAALADPRSQMLPVESEDIGFADPNKFVGTGAWMMKEFVEGAREVYEANPDYYRSWDEGGRPGMDLVERLVVADRGSTTAAFITGEASMLTQVLPHEEDQVRSSVRDAQWIRFPNNDWKHYGINMNRDIFKDVRVRQALQYSTDYQAIGEATGEGWLFHGGLFPPFPEAMTSAEVASLPAYNPANKTKAIADAVKMMDAAGYPLGKGIAFKQIGAQAAGLEFDMAIRMQDQWSKVFPGMEITLVPITDYASFTQLQANREFDTRLHGHTAVPDAAIEAYTYYHTNGGRNYQSFSQPWADQAIEKMMRALTFEDRLAAIRPFQERYLDEGPPLMPLVVIPDKHAFQSNWAGFDMLVGPWGYMSYGGGPRWYWQTKKP